MNQFFKSVLVTVTLFMLSIAVFATKIPIIQDSGVSSVSTSTQAAVVTSLDSELFAQSGDWEVEGWGNADGVDVQIVTIHKNPTRTVNTYGTDDYKEPLTSAHKDLAGAISGDGIILRVSVDYWLGTITNFSSVVVTGPNGFSATLDLADTFFGNMEWMVKNSMYRARKIYQTTFDSTALKNGGNQFVATVTYSPQTEPAKNSTVVNINNTGTYDPDPYNWEHDTTEDNNKANSDSAWTWTFDPNNPPNGWVINNGIWEFTLNGIQKLVYDPAFPDCIFLYDSRYHNQNTPTNQLQMLYDPKNTNTHVNVVDGLAGDKYDDYSNLSDYDLQKLNQLFLNCYAFGYGLNDTASVWTGEGYADLDLIKLGLGNSTIVPLGDGKYIIGSAGRLQPGDIALANL